MDLPLDPCDLIRRAIIDELFALTPFLGELARLKNQTEKAFENAVKERPELSTPLPISLAFKCDALAVALRRLELALRFAHWRQKNDAFAHKLFQVVLGRRPKDEQAPESITLVGKLLKLESIVVAAEPIRKALVKSQRLQTENQTATIGREATG